MPATQQFGVVGLAVMGANLALNVSDRGIPISVYNRTISVTEEFVARNPGRDIVGAKTLEEFVGSLIKPRCILLMVQAGKAVDAVIAQLRPLLDKGDIVIDGGNSHYPDTERRFIELEKAGLRFVGMGVSGGEEGARHGPSLMPGGPAEAYAALAPTLEKIAAKTDTGACVTHVGRGAAGHFVKMVHNGIEYGDMQLIAETYDLLREVGGFSPVEMEETFRAWNRGILKSFLIEITSEIVARKDPETGSLMLDLIVDKAGQKGTGKWTTQAALDLGIAVPTMTAAVDARMVSALKAERVAASKVLSGARPKVGAVDKLAIRQDLEKALYAAKVCSYAQGLAMLAKASTEFQYGLHLDEVARIWKGGCIIRAAMLDRIRAAYAGGNPPVNLLVDASFAEEMKSAESSLRRMVSLAAQQGIAAPALSASLAYYDAYRRERLPAYLTQAQRDFFGAHTFERSDRPGEAVHFEWSRKDAN